MDVGREIERWESEVENAGALDETAAVERRWIWDDISRLPNGMKDVAVD